MRQVAVDAVDLTAVRELEPTVIREQGHADERIVDVARQEAASLVVVGAHGLTGLRALGSVSERVAHRAQCSVLVARPR